MTSWLRIKQIFLFFLQIILINYCDHSFHIMILIILGIHYFNFSFSHFLYCVNIQNYSISFPSYLHFLHINYFLKAILFLHLVMYSMWFNSHQFLHHSIQLGFNLWCHNFVIILINFLIYFFLILHNLDGSDFFIIIFLNHIIV